MKLTIELTGTRQMIQHNGRLANPLDPYTRALAAITKKRSKTEEDLVEIMKIEARGSCWETPEGLLGVPSTAVWRSIYDAAKAYKLGEDIKRALRFDGSAVEPVITNGETVTCDRWVQDGNVDYRSVKVNAKRVMRSRPLIPVGWRTTHMFDLDDDVVDVDRLEPVFERAGSLVGIGEWRPTYGTYTAALI
jgi:hypothetical protein